MQRLLAAPFFRAGRIALSLFFAFSAFLALALFAPPMVAGPAARAAERLNLTTSAFAANAPIPARFTADGQDVSPELRWSAVPKGTVSVAVSCEDPDAPVGTWWHWMLYDLAPSTQALKEGVEKSYKTASFLQGKNDFDKAGYNGPSPPAGKPHRYYFRVYALDSRLPLSAGADKEQFKRAIAVHILAFGELMGTYQRK